MIKQRHKLRSSKSDGFTIIELLIATTVFSVILLLCAFGLMRVGQIYQKGIVTNQSEEAVRVVISRISESIQFSGGAVTKDSDADPTTNFFCIDHKRFTYFPGRKLVDTITNASDQTLQALVVDSPAGGCSEAQSQTDLADGTALGDELLPLNMRIINLVVCLPQGSGATPDIHPECNISRPPAGSELYMIYITIAYGDGDLLDADNKCSAILRGGAFCATSYQYTTVERRIIR